MVATLVRPAPALPAPSWQAAFVRLLPIIHRWARYTFRFVHCEHTRADLVAETVAFAWKRFLALSRRGKRPATFATTFAFHCARAVKAGRKLARGSESASDVLSYTAQKRHGFRVQSLSALTRHQNRVLVAAS
jgi:DNA-directed RNA polymerase specialized sigma24 family protein